MASPRTFGVEGVDGAALERSHGVFYKAGFVQGVGVDGHLRVGVLGHVQTVVDGCWCGAPVFVQLQANRTRIDLFMQGIGQSRVAFAQKTQVHGERVC